VIGTVYLGTNNIRSSPGTGDFSIVTSRKSNCSSSPIEVSFPGEINSVPHSHTNAEPKDLLGKYIEQFTPMASEIAANDMMIIGAMFGQTCVA
jgi:hypothetical protein